MDNTEIQEKIDKLFWEPYKQQTEIFSNICRQMAFAEGGLCWFYISDHQITPDLKSILMFLILFFLSDTLQYFITIILYERAGKYYEKKKSVLLGPTQVKRWAFLNIPSEALFYTKFIFLMLSSYHILYKLISAS